MYGYQHLLSTLTTVNRFKEFYMSYHELLIATTLVGNMDRATIVHRLVYITDISRMLQILF